MPVFVRKATKTMALEFALVTIAVTLIICLYTRSLIWIKVALGISILALLLPGIFRPFAAAWFAIGHLLGRISSTVLMTIVFFLLVTPIGRIRIWLGKDNLKLRQFKKGRNSVLDNRDHEYQESDITNTF